MIDKFIKDYKKALGKKNCVLGVLGYLLIFASIILFFSKKIVVAYLVLLVYLIIVLLYVFIVFKIDNKTKKFSLKNLKNENKNKKNKILKELIQKYNIQDIDLFYQSILVMVPKSFQSKKSFANGLGLFLTIVLYFFNYDMSLNTEKLELVLWFIVLYFIGYKIIDFVIDFFKFIYDKEKIIIEISELLFETLMHKKSTKVNYKNVFLAKLTLGRNLNLQNKEEIIDRCINKAYVDMLSAGKYYINGIKGFVKENLIKDYKKILENNNYVYSRSSILKLSELFGDKEKIGIGGKYVTRFGLAQKIFNMTYKYFYCFNDYLDELKIDYSSCDCPLDSVILDKIFSNKAWSKIDFDSYLECQMKIKENLQVIELDNELSQIGNLAYDFLNW